MNARLTSGVLAGAIRRLAEGQGGFAAILAKGDETSGGLILQLLERGKFAGLFERLLSNLDESGWQRLGAEVDGADDYFSRRRKNDPDLWLIEADVPDVERFIASIDPAP